MKLAVLVVYFLPDERLPILDLHCQAIQSLTAGEFTIYGVAPRVSDGVRRRLVQAHGVTLLEFPSTDAVGSKEHSHYLNKLCEHAIANGATRLCTMDVDAFPISADWNLALEAELQAGHHLAAVFRAENGDTALPHPCCCYFSAEFYQRYQPTYLPDTDPKTDPAYGDFLRQTRQNIDSGIGVGYVLWRHQLRWKKLLRSNQVNDHYLLAGIYGDLIFHLGAMSWTDRDFRKDRMSLPSLRLLDWLALRLKTLGWFEGWVAHAWRKLNYAASRSLVRKTNRTYQHMLEQLHVDPARYITRLRGD